MANSNSDYPWRMRPHVRTPGKSHRWRDRRPPPLDLSYRFPHQRLVPTKEASRAEDKECLDMVGCAQNALEPCDEISTTLLLDLSIPEPRKGSPGQKIRDALFAEPAWHNDGLFGHAHRDLGEDSPRREHQRIPPLPPLPVCEPTGFDQEARDPRWGDDWGVTAPTPGSLLGDLAEDYWKSAVPRTPGSLVGDFAPKSDVYRGLDDPQNLAWYRPDVGGLRAIASLPGRRDETQEPKDSFRAGGLDKTVPRCSLRKLC